MARVVVTLASFVRHAGRKIQQEYAALLARLKELETLTAAGNREIGRMRSLKDALATVFDELPATASVAAKKNGVERGTRRSPKRRFTLTPKARKARKAQGVYLGFIRHWKNKKDVAQVRSTMKEHGYKPTLALIAELRAQEMIDVMS